MRLLLALAAAALVGTGTAQEADSTLLRIAKDHKAKSECKELERVLAPLLRREPPDVEALLLRSGCGLRDQEDVQRHLRTMQELLDQDPRSYTVLMVRGDLYNDLRMFDRAEADLSMAVDAAPDSAALVRALNARAWNRLQRDLSRQTRLAEQAQFSAGMAHQIKNPLAALRGYVELLARGLSDPMQKQLADKLVSEVGALDRIVRDFLQFSRGAHGSVEKLTLEAVLRPVIESARAVGGEKVSIRQQDLPGVELEIDSTAVREALSNVVVNAAEAMRDDGGELSVRAQVGGGLVILEIQDSGPGIAEEVRDKLFEPFVTGKADGTGLGLPIARRLLRDLGGDLELIRSDSSGTMFRATFQKEAD